MTSPEGGPHLDAAAYALHALPPAEEAAFLNHLAGCEQCSGDVAGFQATTARLAAVETAPVAQDAITDVLTAPDATLHTGELGDGAAAAVVVSRQKAEAVFTAHGLPALAGGKVYELWYAEPTGDLRAAGLLPGSGDRPARVLDGPLGDAVAVGITVEPPGGSPQPTTEPLGIVSLST
ncbi:anti-sigma factor [Streptomyces sp. NPDC085466]|uniref:anti-sigma factor n=1 Tax=Streptomyces sp. NPDC085466 TaxID=3365725 RepID=UPI0037CD63F2